MTSMKKFELVARSCNACGSVEADEVWRYDHVARGRTSDYQFDIRNVVCRNCGFVFVSPCPPQAQLDAYYADCYAHFAGQTPTSDIETRARNIRAFAAPGLDGVEIGGNKLVADDTLRAYFRSFRSVEPNEEADPEYRNISDLPSESADVIVHYYVLEHAADPRAFLLDCLRVLRPGGIMICEVPDMRLFPTHVAELLWWEHVSHFSMRSVARIAASCGFSLIDAAHRCSNDRGMMAVFGRSELAAPSIDASPDPLEYIEARAVMRDALRAVQAFENGLEATRREIDEACRAGGRATLWGANDVMRRLLQAPYRLPEGAIVIDDDGRKRDFISGTYVRKPDGLLEHLAASSLLVIGSARLRDVIALRARALAGADFSPVIRVVDYEAFQGNAANI